VISVGASVRRKCTILQAIGERFVWDRKERRRRYVRRQEDGIM
jgi:hypothetical protein